MWYDTCHVKCIKPSQSKAKVGVNIDSNISLQKYLIIASGVLIRFYPSSYSILQKSHQDQERWTDLLKVIQVSG